jgi:tetratricopeptide (TPR) repeat protein
VQAILKKPEYAYPFINKGNALARPGKGKYEEALRLYKEAAEFDAENIDVMSSTGNVYSSQGKYKEAINSYDQALQIAKKQYDNNQMSSSDRAVQEANLWLNKGACYTSSGNYVEAKSWFEKVIGINIDSKNINLYLSKANAFYYLEKYEQAVKYYEKVIALNAKFAVAWANRGAALSLLEKYDEALKSFEKAQKYDKSDPYAWANQSLSKQRSKQQIIEVSIEGQLVSPEQQDEEVADWSTEKQPSSMESELELLKENEELKEVDRRMTAIQSADQVSQSESKVIVAKSQYHDIRHAMDESENLIHLIFDKSRTFIRAVPDTFSHRPRTKTRPHHTGKHLRLLLSHH